MFDASVIGTAEQALDFISNILESSTEYSVIGSFRAPASGRIRAPRLR